MSSHFRMRRMLLQVLKPRLKSVREDVWEAEIAVEHYFNTRDWKKWQDWGNRYTQLIREEEELLWKLYRTKRGDLSWID